MTIPANSEANPSPLVIDKRLRERLAEAVVAQAGGRNQALNKFLRERLASEDVRQGALLSEPVFEGAASYKSSGRTPEDLTGELLHPDLVAALTQGGEHDHYRFMHEAYTHQLEAWQLLSEEQRNSVLISSGTGSGKTECFLVPLLNDLAKEANETGKLVGVRALMLYPLNALIASQEERLRQWTRPFGGKIRFGLYNGLMQEKRANESRDDELKCPEQVLDRKSLRANPPPILVTNNTMLEYMTIRKVDRPLVERSRGQLRWIIIDEAHSYVGSAAAEVALLLRRVMQAFEVEPSQVRFVATSATIGGEGDQARVDLQRYLADLAGVPLSQVHVVMGQRDKVVLPEPKGERVQLDAHGRPIDLACNPDVQSFIRKIEKQPVPLSIADQYAENAGLEVDTFLEGIAAKLEGQKPLLPMRVHEFVRAIPGLWSCINRDCRGRKPAEWPYGAVLFERHESCPHCASAVFEFLNCMECGEGWLNAFDNSERLVPKPVPLEGDEFASMGGVLNGSHELDEDDEVSPDEASSNLAQRRLIGMRAFSQCQEVSIKPEDAAFSERRSEGNPVWLSGALINEACPCCGVGKTAQSPSPLRPFRFGAPFLLQNATPTLLEGVSANVKDELSLPGEGRQLLSFTDSRQGTARFAANIETQSERSYVRAFLYQVVQNTLRKKEGGEDEGAQKIQTQLDALRPLLSQSEALQEMYDALLKEQEQLAAVKPVPWEEAKQKLASDPTVKKWIRKVWQDRGGGEFRDSTDRFAQFLMLRELARRPRRANALETMGLLRLRFDNIEKQVEASIPRSFIDNGFKLQDWKDFLYYIVDVSLRNPLVLRMEDYEVRWILPRHAFPKNIVGPDEVRNELSDRVWPQVRGGVGGKTNVVKLLERSLKLDVGNPEHRNVVNDILRKAWSSLYDLLDSGATTYALDMKKASLEAVTDAWLCPITNKVLPRLALGISPYGLKSAQSDAFEKPIAIQLPRLPIVFPRTARDRMAVSEYLDKDEAARALRELGVWSNLHTRAAMFSPYIRAEEHSAQQPPDRLRGFEDEFKKHEINLLACSTTMEMGVDIGSVEAVLNTNVPPSIANYRQRVGRAGRRGQNFSTSLTFARDMPLDREAFRSPSHYLQTEMRAPVVKLDSVRIVQRHVNALLLACWYAEVEGQLTRTKTGDFFGCPSEPTLPRVELSPLNEFVRWLGDPSVQTKLKERVTKLVQGTVLEGNTTLFKTAIEGFEGGAADFITSWDALRSQMADLGRDIAPEVAGSLKMRLKRLTGEPLLKELANMSLLPGHGFPTAVVPFITDCGETANARRKLERDETNDAKDRRYDYPSRNANVAIREYAPGAEVVIDGLVWTSKGVTLNWQRPASHQEANEVQSLRNFWQCTSCKACGSEINRPTECKDCGSKLGAARRFLEPAGFRVAWSEKPHTHTDMAQYIEPERPIVSAGNSAWSTLTDSALGRYRASQSGFVFYLSYGASKAGYKVCLDCGFATENHASMEDHQALTPRKGESGRCRGNDASYAVTEPIYLGHEVMTDVAEFQPSGLNDEGAAWALASALREVLARGLGIEIREVGLSVDARTGLLGEKTHSIFLYDVASGGAGYSPQLFNNFAELLDGVVKRLDCVAKCRSACSSCILSSDLIQQQDILDRRSALEFVQKFQRGIFVPSEEDVAAPGARVSLPVADALVRKLKADQTVVLSVSSDLDVSKLYQLPISGLFEKAQSLGAKIVVALPTSFIGEMDNATLRGIRNASHRYSFSLAEMDMEKGLNGAELIAHVSSPTVSTGYFSRDAFARVIGDEWGTGNTCPVVCAEYEAPSFRQLHEVDLEAS